MKTARDNMNITTDNTRLTLSFYKHGEVNMYLHNDTGGGIIQSWTVAPANLFRAIVLTMTWPTFMISDYYNPSSLFLQYLADYPLEARPAINQAAPRWCWLGRFLVAGVAP
jgi:hypothetical protein